VFSVCANFLAGEKASSVARRIREQFGRPDITRQKIYPILCEGVRRGYLVLSPPVERDLALRLAERFKLPRYEQDEKAVTVVASSRVNRNQDVAAAAAELVVELIGRVAANPGRDKVHLGLGGGLSAMMVARRLAQRIYSDSQFPKLVLHTLSAGGFIPSEPQKSPVTYFSYFEGAAPRIEYVALFSETVVSNEEFERVRANPSVRLTLERARDIDIVITSLASADDPHGLLRQYLSWLVECGGLEKRAVEAMYEAGWVGDVQFRPYSATGPLTKECAVRAVTLLELSDMVSWAKNLNKYIVLLGGPCAECFSSKVKALRPLLENPDLRVFSHLVVDVQTARELLEG